MQKYTMADLGIILRPYFLTLKFANVIVYFAQQSFTESI